jgi:hypothetical protein
VVPLDGGAEHFARGGSPEPIGVHKEASPVHALLLVISSPRDRWRE